jgi:outer membrane protein OmpA-like peptidoglycan-associated protein/outer membrane protein W
MFGHQVLLCSQARKLAQGNRFAAIQKSMKAIKHVVRVMLLTAAGAFAAPSYAVTFTVDTLDAGTADVNAGDGICQTSTGTCSLRAALEEVNASSLLVALDPALIQFDPSLSGDIVHNGGTPRMHNQTLGSTVINDYLGVGAFLHVDSLRAVTIDFGNRVGAIQRSDNEYAMIYVESNDVVIENFQNSAKRDAVGGGYDDVAGIMGAASSIVIGGSRVTIRNGISADAGTDAMESCISLIDGASAILVEDFYCRGSAGFGLYVDERATVSNVTLNRFETQDGVRFGDIWVEFGEGGLTGDKTVVNGLTITDSEFRSDAINYTMGLRENSVINNLSVQDSAFQGAGVFSIYAYPTSQLGVVTIRNNTATGTRTFFGTDVDVTHTGLLTVSDNILTSVASDGMFLQSPTSGTRIENNRFINQTSAGNVAGIRIATGASGTNNVIRGNLFDQESPTNRFAIWMRAQPEGAGGSGSTGWSIENNTINNIFGDAFGPIYNDGDSNTMISGNTFGEGTRGSPSPDTAPEFDDSFFVVNADAFSNGKIQTWRPTAAATNGVTLTVALAPVDPPLNGNSAPTLPVAIDVYYTETDKAEVYLGRVPGVQLLPLTATFLNAGLSGGAVRAQITDLQGRSSQYSAAIPIVDCLTALPGVSILCPSPPEDPLEVRGTGGGAFGPWMLMALGGLALLRRRAALPLAGLLGVTSAFGAHAEDKESWTSRIYGGAMAGALFTDFDDAKLTRGLQNDGYDVEKVKTDGDDVGYGLWLGYALNPVLGLELAYTTGADERVRFSGSVNDDLKGALDSASPFLTGYGDTYLLRLRYHYALNDRWFLSPHIGAGMTQTRQTFKSGDQTERLEEDTFTWAVGGGVHYALTTNWSVGVGADWYQSDSDNGYSLVGGIVEWRFPRALPESRHELPQPPDVPVEVVPLVEAAAADLIVAAEPPAQTPSVESITLEGVNFELNSDRLTAASSTTLDAAATALQARLEADPQLKIEVGGHTDSTGSEARNLKLSQARAQAVLNHLAEKGVPRDRLIAVGHGASQPLDTNETVEGRSKNRRVELKPASP